MKSLFALIIALCSTLSFGQNATNIYAGGLSFNGTASPRIAGTGLYARLISDGSGTYAFTVFDALPTSVRPFTVSTNMGVGVAQKLFTIGKVPIYVPATAGVAWTGSNLGWQWSGGVLASIPVRNWRIMPNVRFLKSSVGGGGYQVIAPGLLFGFGK